MAICICYGQGKRDESAGPILACGTVNQRSTRRLCDRAQRGQHRVGTIDQVGEVDRGDVIVQFDTGFEVDPGQGFFRQHLGAYVGLGLAHPSLPLAKERKLVDPYAGSSQRGGPLQLGLVVATQIDYVRQPQPQQLVHIRRGECLEIVRPQQPTGNDLAAVGGRDPTDVAQVG